MMMSTAQSLGGVTDLFDGGAFVRTDDLPLVEKDHSQRHLLDHGNQVRRQTTPTAPLDALRLVNDQRASLTGGAAHRVGRGEQLAGSAVAAGGVQEVGAQGPGGGDETRRSVGVPAHEVAQEPYGECGLAAARAAADRDDRALTTPAGRHAFVAAGQVTGCGLADPDERVLLVTDQREGTVAGQVGADMVEEPAGGLPPDVLKRRHLPGVRRRQVPAPQQPCQCPGGPGQLLGSQHRDASVPAGTRSQRSPFTGGGVVQHHHPTHIQPRRALRTPVLKEAAVGGDLMNRMSRHQTIAAHHPVGIQDPAGLPLLELNDHQPQHPIRRGADQQGVQTPPATGRAVLQIHLKVFQPGPHQRREQGRPAAAPTALLRSTRGPEAGRPVPGRAPAEKRLILQTGGDVPDAARGHTRDRSRCRLHHDRRLRTPKAARAAQAARAVGGRAWSRELLGHVLPPCLYGCRDQRTGPRRSPHPADSASTSFPPGPVEPPTGPPGPVGY
ncbi:hypothetical protein NUG23_04120 [Streptomyces sp. PAL114]|nr:hypothetical protein [Streptomyces sp. PAL114]MDU0299568.1 hypothetical protein [Streptomyces sp. PAL114]